MIFSADLANKSSQHHLSDLTLPSQHSTQSSSRRFQNEWANGEIRRLEGLQQEYLGGRTSKDSDTSSTTDTGLVHDYGSLSEKSWHVLPRSTEKSYGALLQICLEYDLDAMAKLEDNHMVSLSILSERHNQLLNQAAKLWGLSEFGQAAIFADHMGRLYLSEEVPIECAADGLAQILHKVGGLETVHAEIVSETLCCIGCQHSLLVTR